MKNLKLFVIGSVVFYLSTTPGYSQNKRVEEKFFPNPITEEQFNTPAFTKHGFTNYSDLISFINELEKKYPEYVKIDWIGESQKGKQIPIIFIKKTSNNKKLKVWYQAGLHGNEPGSTEGILHFLNQLFYDDNFYLLDNIDLAVIPMANIDGYQKLKRSSHNGIDLNRDQTKLEAQETVAIKKAFNKYSPHVAIDFHEYKPYRANYRELDKLGTTSYYDAMFLYSGNLNVSPIVRDLTENLFVSQAKKDLENNNIRHTDYTAIREWRGYTYFYSGGTSPRSSSTSYALTNCISILMEIRGIDLQKQNFKRRVFITKELALSYLKISSQNRDFILDKLGESLQYIKTTKDSVVVLSSASGKEFNYKMIDLSTETVKEYPVILKEGKNSVGTLERTRPEGYYIDSSYSRIIEKLEVLGIEVNKLNQNIEANVEFYQIDSVMENKIVFENRFPLEVKTHLEQKKIMFPKGTYYVSMHQKNSGLLVELLEPESTNSLLSLRVLKLEKNNTMKIYRAIESNF